MKRFLSIMMASTSSTYRSTTTTMNTNTSPTNKPLALVFDAHNHIHMSIGGGIDIPPLQVVELDSSSSTPTVTPTDVPLTTTTTTKKISCVDNDDDNNNPTTKIISSLSLGTMIETHANDLKKAFAFDLNYFLHDDGIPHGENNYINDNPDNPQKGQTENELDRNLNGNNDEETINNGNNNNNKNNNIHDKTTTNISVYGMAIMSTQPRDYPIVEHLVHLLQQQQHQQQYPKVQIIPCFGVHPWFLKQANEEFEQNHLLKEFEYYQWHCYSQEEQEKMNNIRSSYNEFLEQIHYKKQDSKSSKKKSSNNNNNDDTNNFKTIPSWLPYLYSKLTSIPNSQVGEIGLDNARYDDPITKEIICPMDDQIQAFQIQLHLASHLNKAVSIHSVRCWGIFFDTLRKVKIQRQAMKKELKKMFHEYNTSKQRQKRRMTTMENDVDNDIDDDNDDCDCVHEYEQKLRHYINERGEFEFHVLPTSMYMHAFGGNPSIVDQLYAICCKDTNNNNKSNNNSSSSCELFYGFAPIINFRSAKKTADTIRKIGIDHLVLESDLENYVNVRNDLMCNVEFIANALDLDFEEVIEKTNRNANRLYGIHDSHNMID